jgi:hypothetical protein
MKIASALRGTDSLFGVVINGALVDLSALFASPQALVAEVHSEEGGLECRRWLLLPLLLSFLN